jgi:hypothetical protein
MNKFDCFLLGYLIGGLSGIVIYAAVIGKLMVNG